MGRVINYDSAGKQRNQLTRAVVLAIRQISEPNQSLDLKRDLAAFISLSLEAIADTVDQSVTAWEKRGYWVKADRFRLEWLWAGLIAQKLRTAILADDWASVDSLIPKVSQQLSGVKVSTRHRMGQLWVGAWEKLTSG